MTGGKLNFLERKKFIGASAAKPRESEEVSAMGRLKIFEERAYYGLGKIIFLTILICNLGVLASTMKTLQQQQKTRVVSSLYFHFPGLLVARRGD